MDKSSAYEKFISHVDQLRNTECSQKQKIACFQRIAESIMSPALASHINYAAHCGTATNVLLLFCEDFDSVVRMSAEENLNKIFRALEKTRVSRILMDLYGEIKRNGNQRSLRICLNLFSYYAPQIKEKYIKWYAVRLLQCISIISQRKETLLQETLCEFVKHFGHHVQQGLNDSETCKLLETFLGNISSDCAVKRRCSAQNCISLIEHARNRGLMARHGMSKVIEMLLMDQQTSCVLGALGLLRLMLPQMIRGYFTDGQDEGDSLADAGQEKPQQQQQQQQQQQLQLQQHQQLKQAAASDCRQIIEIYDYCLHLLSTQHTTNHAIINAALEVINGILQAVHDATAGAGAGGVRSSLGLGQSLRKLLCNQQLEHNEYLRRRKSLKNQIFQLRNYEVGASQWQELAGGEPQMQMTKNSSAKLQQEQQQPPLKCQQQQQRRQQQLQIGSSSLQVVGINATPDEADSEKDCAASSAVDEAKTTQKTMRQHIRNAARSISECVADEPADDYNDDDDDDNDDDDARNANADDEDDMELLSAVADDEYDGFTTLSQLNEAQAATAASTTTTTTTKATGIAATMSKPQAVQHQSSMQNLLASDDRSQHLSDIDNESFNSIDFDAEITIAGVKEQQTAAPTAATSATPASAATGAGELAESTPDATTIGTFFNNLLSHSNAASESVSKLFRQSSGSKSTPAKGAGASNTDKSDAASTASLTLSLSSLASSSAAGTQQQPSIAETPTPAEETNSATGSYTASTALLMDAPAAKEGSAGVGVATEESEVEPQLRRTPNANPFLAESSPLKQTITGRALISVKIGSILEQSLVYYTARLLAARFLLTGEASGLQPDNVSRVSIKSLSLVVTAQCVRLAPHVLQLPLEISEQELQLLAQLSANSTLASSPQSSNESQRSGELGHSMTSSLLGSGVDPADNLLLLDIKDDHFGPSTSSAFLQSPTLSRSADATLLQAQLDSKQQAKIQQPQSPENQLSKSEIIGSAYRVTVAAEDTPPLALPPQPPKRTKSMRSRVSSAATATPTAVLGSQALSDVLLFHDHCDPMLRGGVQQIVGSFLQASGAGRCLQLQPALSLPHLLAILLKGFEDEIHTVVIQALNAFDKIFPHVVSKYLTGPPCHYHAHQRREQLQQQLEQASGQQKASSQAQTFGQQSFPKNLDNALSSQEEQQSESEGTQGLQQWPSNDDNWRADETRMCARSSATDNDELLAALLNDFQLQSKRLQQQQPGNNTAGQYNEPGPCCVLAISPKLLLSKLRLCRHNKYWLVQNKYAEVISNLNYVLLSSYYANFDCAFDNKNNNNECKSISNNEAEEKWRSRQEAACKGDVAACSKDIVCTYEAQFLDELMQLLGDDDTRVRDQAAHSLCRFIMQTARQQEPATPTAAAATATPTTTTTLRIEEGNMNAETQQTNFNLLWDFFDYRIFGSMSVTLRNLFRTSSAIGSSMPGLDAGEHGHGPYAGTAEAFPGVGGGDGTSAGSVGSAGGAATAASAYFDGSYGDGHVFAFGSQRQIAQEEKVLAKVLYRMTNKLMTLNDKNLQFGIINALRLLLKHFNFVDYQQAWTEFNFIEICMSYAYYNSATAGDLNCQTDLIDVMTKLMAGGMLSSGEAPPATQLDFLLRHSVKLLNIYYHLVGNQRPVQPSGSSGANSSGGGGPGGGGGAAKPSKTGKSELFSLGGGGGKEPATLQAMGYFAGDYVYMKLYNILRGANDSYKITINQDAGGLLICLLKSCLNALSLCLEASPPSACPPVTAAGAATGAATATATTTGNTNTSAPALKLIEEILQYLGKLINYAPGECVACLRQLLKYLFGQNYASQVQRLPDGYHATFVRPYFVAKRAANRPGTTTPEGAASMQSPTATTLGALFMRGMQPDVPPSPDCVRLIKLFEPLVINCLTLFMKSNALVQAPILMLLSQLLDLNVTYSILDSKSVIFQQTLNNLDLIENGIDRNAAFIVPVILKFLVQLTHKSDRPLITIPKIISVTNNLLANGAVRDVALLALKTLSYELFFLHSPLDELMDDSEQLQKRSSCQSPLTVSATMETREALLAHRRELDTQKEVVLGMLEKFVDARGVQQFLALLLLYERSLQQVDAPKHLSAQDANTLYGLVCRSLASGHLRVHNFEDFRLLESCFRNNGNYVLADSKEFLQLLQLFIEQAVGNFGDLALATITLANVILKTEEIYLVNHIKLYLKNNPRAAAAAAVESAASTHWQDEEPSTSSAAAARASSTRAPISEINYFARVLSEKLIGCLDALLQLDSSCESGWSAAGFAYCQLAGRFVKALFNVCCRSRHKDALQSVFRSVLAQSEFLAKYNNLLLMSAAGGDALEPVLLACQQLLLAMRLMDPLRLLAQAAELPLKWSLQRALLHEVCSNSLALDWNPQQVRRLCAGKYLNFLIADHLEFLCELCQVRPECGSLLLTALIRRADDLNKHSIRSVLRLLNSICVRHEEHEPNWDHEQQEEPVQALQLLSRLHQLHDGQRALQLPMERQARRLAAQSTPATRRCVYERLLQGELAGGEDQDELRTMLLKELESPQNSSGSATAAPRIIDESWLFGQLIKFATQHVNAPQQQQQLMRLLLDIQSEHKLQSLLRSLGPLQEARLLRHALDGALSSMLSNFRQKCIQHAPHINYLQLPPLARVACASLMSRLSKQPHLKPMGNAEQLDIARALTTLLVSIRRLEETALVYVDAKQIDKFVAEQLLPPQQLPVLLQYGGGLAEAALRLLQASRDPENAIGVILDCLDALLKQQRVWWALNASSDELRVLLLQVPVRAACHVLHHTIFYQRHRAALGKGTTAKAAGVFLAKLIETHMDEESKPQTESEQIRSPFAGQELATLQVPLPLIASIGTSLLRTHQLYAYAVTPYELVQQQQQEQKEQQPKGPPSVGKLPTIPVDSLSDVDVLRAFVKRLSIFGYTTRQQFEEYFMTFLLLINKVYDEHMVDQQEQFQIKQVCLLAIMELLASYKTFPVAGLSNSQFYHTTRWTHINCDSISLKKLHKVQLVVDATCNVFYLANLERKPRVDNVIGTHNFTANQCDLNFSWALMEAYAQSPPYGTEEVDGYVPTELGRQRLSGNSNNTNSLTNVGWRNYRHFVQLSGIDIRSSMQLVFDVLQQMIEVNHILVLPNLVIFCEICESRDQIKWIRDRMLRLQEQIAMDDTISHENIIYLLCRTQALLIPSHGELQHLAALIGNVYLKSSHCFIRIAALQGMLRLLECCSRTNTSIGKLSDELALLRDLIVGYINRHGIIDESPLEFSDAHTKLVWTLNYSLIEWTSRFVPQCHLLSNTIIAANNFLKKTHNEELYLCVLHGLERIVVSSGCASGAPTAVGTGAGVAAGGDAGMGAGGGVGAGAVVTPQLRHKIEKLALELLKMENEKFSIPALKLLLSCMYVGSAAQLENTELSNGIVQDDPEIIALQSDKVDLLLHCIKSSSRDAAWIYGQVLCQIIRDLVPPNEILTKVIKEFLAINQPHGDVIATIVYQVFRSAIDSSYLQMLQDWLICTLPTFLALPERQGVWGLSVIFLSASINLHLIKLFPLVLAAAPAPTTSACGSVSVPARKLGQHEIALFVTAAQDFHAKLSAEQKLRFREAFASCSSSASPTYAALPQLL